jgi:hypothetical protein
MDREEICSLVTANLTEIVAEALPRAEVRNPEMGSLFGSQEATTAPVARKQVQHEGAAILSGEADEPSYR